MTGLALAAAIIGGFVLTHILGVFGFPLHARGLLLAVPFIALQTWLGAGMFIVAHDAMHGSLAPGRPRLNRMVGRLALALYAGFPFDALAKKHHAHHRHAGGADDPDFHAGRPQSFWPWYARFFRQYFGWTQIVLIGSVSAIYLVVLHAVYARVMLFWALPSLLSSLQLFTFGTWLPHRHHAGITQGADFVDAHRARSLDYGWWVSLFACFHFGYHLEHHHCPQTPWWRLPAERRRARFTPG